MQWYVIYGRYHHQTVQFKSDEKTTGKDNSLVMVEFVTKKHAHSFNKLQKNMHTCDWPSGNRLSEAKLILKKTQKA